MEMAREIQYPHPKVLPMNTTQTTVDVKRFLKEKIRDELVPALEQLVDELPDDLVGFSHAEQLLRGRFLKLAGGMLQGWTEVARTRIAIPRCPSCGKPMRHKGLKPCTLATTLGDVRLRRPRYRCMHCKMDIYPHDQHTCVGEIDLVQFLKLAYINTVVNTPLCERHMFCASGGGGRRAGDVLDQDSRPFPAISQMQIMPGSASFGLNTA